jgi:sugar phosphate isomerase/epimerase
MHLAFSTNAFSLHPLDTALHAISEIGYPGVEILADKPHWYPDHFNPAEADVLHKLLDSLRLSISNINANCTFGYWQNPPPEPFFEPSLISPDPALRADRVRMIQNTLHFAKAIGADNISITSGKALPTMPPDRALQQLNDSLRTVLDTAHHLNIKIGIECEPMLFIEWATELRALIDSINSPLLGANLDLGHSTVLGEDIPATLQLLKGRIWNCHIEDIPGRKHYHLIPGHGTFNWQALRAAISAINYDRFLTVELYTYPDRPIHAAQESLAFLRPIFGAPSSDPLNDSL